MAKVKESNEIWISNYLEEEGIKIPRNFKRTLFKKMNRFYSSEKTIQKEAIEAVLKICREWKPYLADENEFHKLVCEKVYSMVSIHSAVISSSSRLNAYIGNICELKEGVVLPEKMSTVATFEGVATLESSNLQKTL